MKIIEIRDYVTLPCDDASEGIRRAFEDAKAQNADEIRFEAGVYNLKTPIAYDTDQSAHDAGAVLQENKEVLIPVIGFKNFTVRGAIDENGEPATLLAGINTMELHSLQPAILWCEFCENLTVMNLKLTRAPEFGSAGRVEEVDGGRVRIRVFEGNVCHDNMGTYCMNRFTPDGSTLNGASLSYGPGLGTEFRLIGDRLLEVNSDKLIGKVAPDDIITWHQGSRTDFQCYFGSTDNLTLKNLRTVNANGFAMIAFNIHNLTADRVVFKPEREHMYFTCPRDAWKLHKCSGFVENTRFYVEGVRMDGQNVHNNYIFIRQRLSDTELIAESHNARTPFRTGSEDGGFEFFRDEKSIGKATLLKAEHISTVSDGTRTVQRYKMTFDALPDTVDGSALICALALYFSPTVYHCRDSQFRNVAGAGHLLRTPYVRIENCTYTNMMNAGIMLGAEYPTHYEGGHCEDVKITGCHFDNCGFSSRYYTIGCVGIHSGGFKTPVNHNIEITDCVFRNSEVGVDVHTAYDVRVSGCAYLNIKEEFRLN